MTEDGFLDGRLRMLQPEKGYRAGIDAVFLAATIPFVAGDSVYEAGIGTGVAALCALARNPAIHVTGIEIAARYALLCEENARRNGFGDNLRVIHADIKEALRKDLAAMPAHGSFSHAFANPPYFDEAKATASPVLLKAQAHAFGPDDLDLWIKVMHTMVTLRGTVTIVHRAESLGKLLAVMEDRFGDIRIAPLYAREGTAASRVIVQGVKGSKAPMQLLPGLVLHDQSSQFTPEANAILREGHAWRLR
ncbi:MAG: methyltransferase [Rhizobiales bacterium]|nr:methyltransferase [Hyphomicrobiales bacterium]MBI3674339.1 methyltransferase [Hyphomicrobiales bacterium]